MGSTLGRIFRVTTFGESHGEMLGCVVENCPSGLELTEQHIQYELDRRRPGQSRITTPRNEPDQCKIVSGTFSGVTIGSPISIVVENTNAKEKDYSNFEKAYRPSHADYTYQVRYGNRSTRGGGRASARTTIGIVAAGAIAKKILREKYGVEIVAYVNQIHKICLPKDYQLPSLSKLQQLIEENPVRCPDQKTSEEMVRLIQDTRQAGDSLGGIISCCIENLPPGVGDPVFDKLDALLAYAMLAIPATKGFELGSGFSAITMTGSQHNDLFVSKSGKIGTNTNFSGGIQGGISNGEPIEFRVAFKPTATISHEQETLDEDQNKVSLKVKGRHDPCVLPRAVPIVEAFSAVTLLDQLMLKESIKLEDLRP
jgi:chorismate synthase